MSANQILTATFALGNSSGVRKRVTAILHDNNFSDLAACTFWLPAGQTLSPYSLRTYTTQPWTNATLSVYAATTGTDPWIQLDDVTLRRTPGAVVAGTECIEPETPPVPTVAAGTARLATRHTPRADPGTTPNPPGVQLGHVIDLTQATDARLILESWLTSAGGHGEIQVSLDGKNWVPHAVVGPSDDWIHLEVDLGAWLDHRITIRFVIDETTPRPLWRLRNATIVRSR
jgi:hypothetical protein